MAYPKLKNKHLEEALFSPDDFIRYKNVSKRDLPKNYILIYSNRSFNYFKRKYNPKKIEVYDNITIYKYNKIGIVKMNGIGSPHVVTVMEELIALGGKNFLNIGVAGGLYNEGVFLCTKALRDEGTSYHYLPHGHFTYPNKYLSEILGENIKKQGLEFLKGTTWTIDAPYRETKREIERYSKRGVKTVEMEASALFAVAQYRKVKVAAAFVVSDVLNKKWDPKFHKIDVRVTLNKLIDASINCLSKI